MREWPSPCSASSWACHAAVVLSPGNGRESVSLSLRLLGIRPRESSCLCLVVDALLFRGCIPASRDSCVSSSRTSCWTGLLAGLPGGPSSTKQARPWPHHPWGRVVCPPDGGHHAGVGDPDEHWHGAFRVLVSPPDCLWRAAQVFSRPLRGPQVGGGPFHVDAGSVRCVL